MEVLSEYQKLTKSNLYRTEYEDIIEPKNEFEEKLHFSNRFNQKEVIKLIKEEIDRIKQ